MLSIFSFPLPISLLLTGVTAKPTFPADPFLADRFATDNTFPRHAISPVYFRDLCVNDQAAVSGKKGCRDLYAPSPLYLGHFLFRRGRMGYTLP